jgi:hypothetical protein
MLSQPELSGKCENAALLFLLIYIEQVPYYHVSAR